MSVFNPVDHPHRRYNPLTGQWILVSSRQGALAGAQETPAKQTLPAHDPDCFLCPGNTGGPATPTRITPVPVITQRLCGPDDRHPGRTGE
ncbi:hypothetical protein [Klebsiella pneumoniae]|uniref:hypothetical protein n=1 Tax=Klebsiella pneumoniae TaxID=573 RepID=UPI0038905D61